MESYNSFPSSLNRDHALAKWYQDIRVDFLTDDELSFELAVRYIMLEGDRSQMRRCLRARLKVEKIDSVSVKSLKTDPKFEVHKCKEKLEEIEKCLAEKKKETFMICKDRLLHLGARVKLVYDHAPEHLKDDLLSIFTIVTDHLYYFFYKSVSFEQEREESGEEHEEEENDCQSLEDVLKDIPKDTVTVQVAKRVLLRELDRRKRAEDSVTWLKAEIIDFQYRLQASLETPKTWNAHVQTEPIDILGSISNSSSAPMYNASGLSSSGFE